MDLDEKTPASLPHDAEPPPRGVRVMAVVRWAILALTALVAVGMWISFARGQIAGEGASAHPAVLYRCPMHPQIVSTQPGECPICHMTLEPFTPAPAPAVDAGAPPPPASAPPPHRHAGAAPTPGAPAASTASTPPPPPGSTPPGTMPIALTLDRVQSIGVRTAVATSEPVGGELRVTAVVAETEQGATEVHVRAPGFVEHVFVAETGKVVGAGQPLLSMYSPDIYQAETELASTHAWGGGDAGSPAGDAARKKLELLGVGPGDIDRVVQKGEASRDVAVSAPRGGTVTKKQVVVGSYVTPEMVLYTIEDLSTVYVVADLLPGDAALVHAGLPARFFPSAVPGASPGEGIESKVDLVYPAVDAQARTTRVRLSLKNPGRALLPGAYGSVVFATSARTLPVVPRDAVVDTGEMTYVFVVTGEGRYAPRVVALGAAHADGVAVEAGLAPGERVVSGATFLIDSESRLEASLAPAVGSP